jgi:hypothetical protein
MTGISIESEFHPRHASRADVVDFFSTHCDPRRVADEKIAHRVVKAERLLRQIARSPRSYAAEIAALMEEIVEIEDTVNPRS